VNNRRTHQSYFNGEAGKELTQAIQDMITRNYLVAENDPAETLYAMQRAAGNREVLTHIQSITADLERRGA
jgi:hypothetical protein